MRRVFKIGISFIRLALHNYADRDQARTTNFPIHFPISLHTFFQYLLRIETRLT